MLADAPRASPIICRRSAHAYILERPDGKLLLYNTGDERDIEAIAEVAGSDTKSCHAGTNRGRRSSTSSAILPSSGSSDFQTGH